MNQFLLCGLCNCTIDDAVIIPCGHGFCRSCIKTSLSVSRTCPTCKREFQDDTDEEILRSDHLVNSSRDIVRKLITFTGARINALELEQKEQEAYTSRLLQKLKERDEAIKDLEREHKSSSDSKEIAEEEIRRLETLLSRKKEENKALRNILCGKNRQLDDLIERNETLKEENDSLKDELNIFSDTFCMPPP